MATPAETIIDQLLQDKDFVGMNPDEQDSIIDELLQSKLGTVPKTENLLERSLRIAGGIPEGFADVSTFGLTKVARDAGTDLANQIVPPTPESIAATEDLLRQDPTGKFIGGAIPILGGIGALGKGIAKTVAGKFFAKRALPKASKKLSESLQEVIKRSKADPQNLGVHRDEVIKVLKDGLAKAKDKSGTQGVTFKRWIKILEGEKEGKVTADVLSEMETSFGAAAKFNTRANNAILQKSAKDVNRFLSKRVDLISEKSGVPQFITRSAKKSKLLKESKTPTNFLGQLIKRAAQGAALTAGGTAAFKLFGGSLGGGGGGRSGE